MREKKPPESRGSLDDESGTPPFYLDELDDVFVLLRNFLVEQLDKGQLNRTSRANALAVAQLMQEFAELVRAQAGEDSREFSMAEFARRLASYESVGECLAAVDSSRGRLMLQQHLDQLPSLTTKPIQTIRLR